MAKFVKGQSGNPKGSKKKDLSLLKFRKISYEDFLNSIQKYWSLTKDGVKALMNDPESTAFELIVAKIILQAIDGEKDARQLLIDRLWGKAKETVEHITATENRPQVVVYLPDNGRKASIEFPVTEPIQVLEEATTEKVECES